MIQEIQLLAAFTPKADQVVLQSPLQNLLCQPDSIPGIPFSGTSSPSSPTFAGSHFLLNWAFHDCSKSIPSHRFELSLEKGEIPKPAAFDAEINLGQKSLPCSSRLFYSEGKPSAAEELCWNKSFLVRIWYTSGGTAEFSLCLSQRGHNK